MKLLLTLDARSSVEELMLPLDEGMVEVMATMAPTSKPANVELTTEYFTGEVSTCRRCGGVHLRSSALHIAVPVCDL